MEKNYKEIDKELKVIGKKDIIWGAIGGLLLSAVATIPVIFIDNDLNHLLGIKLVIMAIMIILSLTIGMLLPFIFRKLYTKRILESQTYNNLVDYYTKKEEARINEQFKTKSEKEEK